MTQNFLSPNLCTKCGGKCCKRLPGAAMPEDFMRNGGSLHDNVLSAIRSGNWVVDWWEGDPRGLDYEDSECKSCGYYLRPRAKNDRDSNFCPSWGGECVFLGESGCILGPENRPANCRMLEPKENGECIDHSGGKNAAALAWLPYHRMLSGIPMS